MKRYLSPFSIEINENGSGSAAWSGTSICQTLLWFYTSAVLAFIALQFNMETTLETTSANSLVWDTMLVGNSPDSIRNYSSVRYNISDYH